MRALYVSFLQALALCSFLDNNRQRVNLQGKTVLELGAGTGLVTIVASLLGEQTPVQVRQHIHEHQHTQKTHNQSNLGNMEGVGSYHDMIHKLMTHDRKLWFYIR